MLCKYYESANKYRKKIITIMKNMAMMMLSLKKELLYSRPLKVQYFGNRGKLNLGNYSMKK